MKKYLFIFISACLAIFASSLTIAKDDDTFEKLIKLHEYKLPPGQFDWMAVNPEPGQSFDEYIKTNPVRPTEEKNIIYITLLGDFGKSRRKIIDETAEFIEIYYDMPIKFTDPISLDDIPDSAKRVHPQTKDPQVLTSYIIEDVLKPIMPDDAFSLIAFTSSDLWPGEGWNFVFGQASLEDRVGVWSIYRNGIPSLNEEAYNLCLLRTIKTGTHELGHMFSMHHCIYFECNMNGSNHRAETDNRPLWLCPVCLKKLDSNKGLNLVERYKKLLKFSKKHKFDRESEFFHKSESLIK